jgi:hypothetical protein
MVFPHGLLLVLYVLPPPLQIMLAVLMVRKGLHRHYHFFFAYTVLSVFLSIYFLSWSIAFTSDRALYLKYYPHYFTAYWSLFAIRALLAFFILYRAFARACSGYRSLQSWGSVLFGIAVAVSLVIAIIGAEGMPHHEIHSLTTGVLAFSQSAQTILAGMFAFVLLFSIVAAVPLWEYGFGIVAGFGVQAVVLLAAFGFRSYSGPQSGSILEYANASAYLLAVGTWLGYLVMPMRGPFLHASNVDTDSSVRHMQALKDALKEFWQR